jgi:hypothetical protein
MDDAEAEVLLGQDAAHLTDAQLDADPCNF